MNEKRKTYIVGAVISLGIYLVCSFLGAFVNVLISLASGYSHFSDFKSGDNYSGLILFVVFTLVNHTFFAWLTVKLVSKYARKQGHLSNIVFIISAAIILAYFFIALLLGFAPGILTVIIHDVAILLWGLYDIKHPKEKPVNHEGPTKKEEAKQTIENSFESQNIYSAPSARPEIKYCHKCGCNVQSGSMFCHKCGSKLG